MVKGNVGMLLSRKGVECVPQKGKPEQVVHSKEIVSCQLKGFCVPGWVFGLPQSHTIGEEESLTLISSNPER
jgi:hypothetical protein